MILDTGDPPLRYRAISTAHVVAYSTLVLDSRGEHVIESAVAEVHIPNTESLVAELAVGVVKQTPSVALLLGSDTAFPTDIVIV